MLFLTAIVTPFEIAFLETKLDTMFFLNRLLDIGFMADIIVQFNLAYYSRQGELVTNKYRSVLPKCYLLSYRVADPRPGTQEDAGRFEARLPPSCSSYGSE
jgi:hypothetical protein